MIVVAAGIVSRNGKIMLCQRRPEDRLGLKWEFPGGKLESGESPQQALERELREELAIETRTGRIFDIYHESSGDRSLLLLFFRSEILSGEPKTLECNAVAWVDPHELTKYDLAPADMEVAKLLAKEL
ncbi:MAG: (deoxy)nucleoside triphosphate pyrophosphohydrolase [Clostridia bacterium]|nr:(deoxy)nucleoside triphosphate pyrophosphohydrolase [Clostridia bacterium]